DPQHPDFDYIVVGSGAGGGPVACNLAKAGYKVGLIEAGQEPDTTSYPVPVFHTYASEDPAMSWDFFVQHYSQNPQRDSKYRADKGGIFYPRAGTLGGCTAHNAMITVYGHGSDWDHVARLTGDPSWAADKMRAYFERIESCGYVPRPGAGQPNPTRHGWDGWLRTTGPELSLVFGDPALIETILGAIVGAWKEGLTGPLPQLLPQDPNDWRTPQFEGICFAPAATLGGRRVSTRELIDQTRAVHPQQLVVKMSNLATKVLFDGANRAIGVECWEGQHLYRADPQAVANPLEGDDYDVVRYYCAREVILAGGAFNSPQLLMLSGIGPHAHLEQVGITCLLDRPGVGTNLQDRYEVGVVTEMQQDWKLLSGATFAPPLPNQQGDPCYVDWQNGKGVYTTGGAVLGIIKKSAPERPDPDLFIFALPGKFDGYFPGYSHEVERTKNYLTWAILAAHTNNTAGTVRLRSASPLDSPEIHFKYFDEGNDGQGNDAEAVANGVEFVRRISQKSSAIKQETVPGPAVGTHAEIVQFVKDNAWGHHASCTNPMGPASDPNAVVDSNFRVIGTQNLRIVDASVFPRIPGFFIVTPIYMIAEKASDVILADARP
ncbi:MAG TPA: GMC family oxidoreductase, partial [Thermoanaerobaculia bacterium]|nr:GMC family oxidoreductase [Thermoanaerobaculia bacterium]